MSDVLPITEARIHFGRLVRQASTRRERTTITDHGQAAAVIISAQELEELEDALAFAQYDLEKQAGTLRTVPHREARERLGLAEA
ncbi:type II toxin-antitoxin system Phd/YefM family antitoxin [Kribbella sp. NPDC058693]|uniref:type II toxin-antitoxin system Phd/YefM family antitoxin n=1 Tax=Kribbella sp. NPDC058693 TaxID=3346602 RepID=UPI003656C2C2